MKKIITLIFFAITLALWSNNSFCAEPKSPNVAGAFYPADPKELSQKIDSYLKEANPEPIDGQIFALISPHAGYDFSGKTAAYDYKLIQGKDYKTVVVLGPSHRYPFVGISVYPDSEFITPLGSVEVDKDFSDKLLGKEKNISFIPQAFAREHSVEVEIPFLQKTLKEKSWKIVPVVMGDCTFTDCENFAKLLKDAVGSRKDVLIVASTDLYHGYDYEQADKEDNITISYINNLDAPGLYKGFITGSLHLCGGFPVTTTLLLAKESGHNKVKLLKHTNSAEATGNYTKGNWTVGYGSFVIDNPELSKNERKKLLNLARQSIEYYLKNQKIMEIEESDSTLIELRGVFVTLRKNGVLRGCIGDIIATRPLYLAVRDRAVDSAINDWRFKPVTLSELKDIEVEISVLSPMTRVKSSDDIVLGLHGVMLKNGSHGGVFLPQVATETGWGKEEFLSELCSQKAGLDGNCWKDPSTELYIFTAEVFSESNY